LRHADWPRNKGLRRRPEWCSDHPALCDLTFDTFWPSAAAHFRSGVNKAWRTDTEGLLSRIVCARMLSEQ
jgi:hypothetical protein